MKRALAWIAVAVVVLAVGGSALAAIPDSSGIIHGCYLTSGNPNVRGALRVIDTEVGETCSSSEAAIEWDQASPEPRYYTVVVSNPTGVPDSQVVDCDEGDIALGGGWEWVGSPGFITDSFPHQNPQEWGFQSTGGPYPVDFRVRCADLPPYRA